LISLTFEISFNQEVNNLPTARPAFGQKIVPIFSFFLFGPGQAPKGTEKLPQGKVFSGKTLKSLTFGFHFDKSIDNLPSGFWFTRKLDIVNFWS
jgi:hypothetical protein